LRSPRWFPKAALSEPVSHTFIGEVRAPLAPGIRAALTALFEMLWGAAISEASAVDQREFERMCRQQSPDFILDLPEYYAFFTYTMFSGVVMK
jgi:demethylmenaquinone methyltransferase/2-methoxy-6-polyprenyl-1,4-benzoquinol methylase